MLEKANVFGSFSVSDTGVSRKFYEEVLGLTVHEEMGVLRIKAGRGEFLAYPKPDHQPAGFTVLNFAVENIEDVVSGLNKRGVAFERYDGIDQDEHGIARDPRGPAMAWFTDPSGNILSVLQE